ncbi:metal ABC transporter substrate-binding protein [Candidatus Curculioniphilus buchneri]|uniref:metal ABC transporter substrate-binding protein n=1 Tax=Candidatus Curculioniphilus buchneri TaxID=690594 RepID=UPI00376F2A22
MANIPQPDQLTRSSFILYFLYFIILLLFTGKVWAQKKFQVITTFTIIQDMAQQIAGHAAEVHSITRPGAEVHNYQPTPRDIAKTQKADLILWNGMNLESWFRRFFNHIYDVPSVVVTEGINPMLIRDSTSHDTLNPHAWMSPINALVYIENILKALVKYDPSHTEIYNHNARNYAKKIKAIDAMLRARLAKIPDDQRWLVTSEGAFSYLAHNYHLREVYLWPINADEQGTPQQVKNVIDIVRHYHIPVVFSESTVSDKPARQVSKESGASYGGVLYVDSLSAAGGPVPTYLDLLNITVDTIAKGFGQ